MNKKLLGIAAVALLGVSAAFAATTSTVYFTASGTLTKVEASGVGLLGYNNLLPLETGKYCTDKCAIKKYQGVEIIDKNNSTDRLTACSVTLDETTKVTNSNSAYIAANGSYAGDSINYLYTNVTLSNLEFEMAGDYIVLPITLLSIDGSNYSYNFQNSISMVKANSSAGWTNPANIVGYSDLTVSGDDASLFTVRFGTDAFYMLYPSQSSREFEGITYTYSSTTETGTISTSTDSIVGYVSIQLKENVTTAKKFSSLSFSLPEFSKVTE